MSAMSRSRMPQKTRFAYTRSPEAVAHQPVPANARIALKASKPATTNMMTAAKVNMPGLRATAPAERSMGSVTPPGIGSLCCATPSLLSIFSLLRLRFADLLLDFLRLCPDLLVHLLVGPLVRFLNSPLDRRLAHYYQSRFTLVEQLAYLLEVRERHAPVQPADKGASSRPYQPADQDRGREDHTATIAPTGELASSGLGNSPLLSRARLAAPCTSQCSLAAGRLSSPNGLFPLGDFPKSARRQRDHRLPVPAANICGTLNSQLE